MVIGLKSGNLDWEYIFIILVLSELRDIFLWLVQRDTEVISDFRETLSSWRSDPEDISVESSANKKGLELPT
jgi:hypothetical protein